jgi:aminoglycoside 3-N-acetyltransferase
MKEKIKTDLRNLGIQPTDTVLVHSSYKSLGLTQGNPQTVVDALMETIGTLLLPALSYESVTDANPVFTVDKTPCCVGIIPETFRKTPGVRRSVHPTHSVCAYGKYGEEITAKHHLDRTPVGENSPFRLLMDYNGKILMLGCGLEPNTFIHGVEEAVGTPYVLTKDKALFEIVYEDGHREFVSHYTHDFIGTEQRYERVEGLMEMKKGKVLDAVAYVMDARELWETVAGVIKRESLYFVDRE